MLLDQKWIHDVHDAAVSARLHRSALLAGIDPHFAQGIGTGPDPKAQLLIDLETMNRVGRTRDGSAPLVQWLQTAAHLARSLPEGPVFERALEEAERALTLLDTAPKPPGPTPQTPTPAHALHVYLSFDPEDLGYVEALEKHLTPLLRRGLITIWHRGMADENVDHEARQNLVVAGLVVAMVSPDWVSSEKPLADVTTAQAAGKRVLPVRVSQVNDDPLSELQHLPRMGAVLAKRSKAERDEAFAEIAAAIRAIAERYRGAAT